MERFLQYWDDLDDLCGAIGLVAENIRRTLLFGVYTTCVGVLQLAGIVLALVTPPLALALATILFVTLLYRAVTTQTPPSALT